MILIIRWINICYSKDLFSHVLFLMFLAILFISSKHVEATASESFLRRFNLLYNSYCHRFKNVLITKTLLDICDHTCWCWIPHYIFLKFWSVRFRISGKYRIDILCERASSLSWMWQCANIRYRIVETEFIS